MYQILFYDKDGKWFSTTIVQSWYESDLSIIKKLKAEINDNLERWNIEVTYSIFHNNRNVDAWYQELSKEI